MPRRSVVPRNVHSAGGDPLASRSHPRRRERRGPCSALRERGAKRAASNGGCTFARGATKATAEGGAGSRSRFHRRSRWMRPRSGMQAPRSPVRSPASPPLADPPVGGPSARAAGRHRPESRAPSGFARKMFICVVALLGIVVARRRAEQVPPAKRVDATPQALHRPRRTARWHPAPRSHPLRGPCSALRGRATTFVARLGSEHFSCQTRLPEGSSTAC